MPQKITSTAQLICDKGTTSSLLSVTFQNFSTIENKAVATEQDNKSNENIKPFGKCKLKPSSSGYLPCSPLSTIWKNESEKDEINGSKILIETSICECAAGGKISVQDKGHTENHETR